MNELPGEFPFTRGVHRTCIEASFGQCRHMQVSAQQKKAIGVIIITIAGRKAA